MQNKALRALQSKNHYYPTNEMHKEFQILKVADIVEYKLSNLTHSLLPGTSKLPKTSTNLLLKWLLTPEIQDTNLKFTIKKKIGQSENYQIDMKTTQTPVNSKHLFTIGNLMDTLVALSILHQTCSD